MASCPNISTPFCARMHTPSSPVASLDKTQLVVVCISQACPGPSTGNPTRMWTQPTAHACSECGDVSTHHICYSKVCQSPGSHLTKCETRMTSRATGLSWKCAGTSEGLQGREGGGGQGAHSSFRHGLERVLLCGTDLPPPHMAGTPGAALATCLPEHACHAAGEHGVLCGACTPLHTNAPRTCFWCTQGTCLAARMGR